MTGSPSSAIALYPSISVLCLPRGDGKACPAIATGGLRSSLATPCPQTSVEGQPQGVRRAAYRSRALGGALSVPRHDPPPAGANPTQRTSPEVKITAFAHQATAMG